MSAEERMMRYCRIDTQSDPDNEQVTPSSEKQFNLARMLEKELKELGLENVECDEHCYVYGWLPSNTDHQVKTVGFIAHMDTAPDFSGTNVNPRVIENYDGGDIELGHGRVTRISDFPQMKRYKGKRLMVTDGSTLLGADDKAGITCIMEALEYLQNNPQIKHGRIAVGFTPDEEIGNGPKYFDIEKFGADFAYTMDGGEIDEYSDETFNASSAVVSFAGFSIHPGSAKNKMINAAAAACKFQSLLPSWMTPEHTEGREGFLHMTGMHGNVEKAELDYIIRDHDVEKLEEKKKLLRKTADYINASYGTQVCTVEIKDGYRNMKEVLSRHPEVRTAAWNALEELGISPVNDPIRGGTDGAELSFRGLPCPNLGNGGGNCHGPYEYCVLDELEQARDLILHIVSIVEKEK